MTNHPNRNLPIRSIGRNAYPGDQTRVMMGGHKDSSGGFWPHKTEYVPQSMGVANTMHGVPAVQSVSIGGKVVEFVGAKTVRTQD